MRILNNHALILMLKTHAYIPIIITKHFFSHPRKPILPIEMELDVLEMNGSVSSDEKAVEEHCKKMTALKEKVFNSAEENIKCAQIRYKRDYDNKHAGRRKVCSINVLLIN